METWQDRTRALALSIGVHLICFGLIGMGLWWQKHSRPPSVAGAPIEAVLWTGPLPAMPPASAPSPPPARTQPPPAKSEPAQPLRRPDTVDRERAAALTQRQSEERAQREEQERQRQRQIELSQEERQRQARAEAARRALEEDRQRQDALDRARTERQQAERQSRLQQERLAQLADLEQPQPAPLEGPRVEPQAAEPVGNFGTESGLADRYMLAIQQSVTQNWLRPDTTRPGLQCRLRIIQIPGGEVINAEVMAPCNGDDLARRSIEAAVLRAQPLPYTGYESVFQRVITFNFRYDG